MVARWSPNWPALSDFGWDGFLAEGIQKTVATDTQRKYRSAFSRFIDFLVMWALPFNLEGPRSCLVDYRAEGFMGRFCFRVSVQPRLTVL